MRINVYRSPDNRLRTESYRGEAGEVFSIAELTVNGTLISEFKTSGEIVNQVYTRGKNSALALSEHLKDVAELQVSETPVYERVKVNAACAKCGNESIERELDLRDTSLMSNVPVVPIFLCRKCGSRFYSMSDAYLRNLVLSNVSLFEADELAERSKDESKFIVTLQEYIIRIFASKKIQRLNIKG